MATTRIAGVSGVPDRYRDTDATSSSDTPTMASPAPTVKDRLFAAR